jgi:hypothetical protein
MTWRETVVTYLRYYPGICAAGQRKMTKASVKTARVLTDIRNEYLQNTCIEDCHYTSLFDAYLLFPLVHFSTSLPVCLAVFLMFPLSTFFLIF